MADKPVGEPRRPKRAEDCIYVNHSPRCRCRKTGAVIPFKAALASDFARKRKPAR